MGWSDSVVDDRRRFVEAWLTRRYTVVELAERFGVSERVAHKVLARFKAEGFDGLIDRSRARHCQQRTAENVVAELVRARRRFPQWGARKLLGVVKNAHPMMELPAASTVTEILRRAGLLNNARKRRSRPVYPTSPCVAATAPNDSWSMDYKGQFRTGDRGLCYPFTVTDNFSRMIFRCRALESPNLDDTWSELVGCFREYGLPTAIRSDNGAPFAGGGLTRLSQLSVRLIKLNVIPDYIARGKPQQNGRHERMHRTLKEATASPPARNCAAQQRRFNRFVEEFNHVRPHEALDQKRPADVHIKSSREMPLRLPKVEYDNGVITRAIRHNGSFKWGAAELYLTRALVDERVAFHPIDDGLYLVRFNNVDLVTFDERTGRLRAAGKMPPPPDRQNEPLE